MYMSVLTALIHVYLMCAWYPQRPEEDIGALGTGVADTWVLESGT